MTQNKITEPSQGEKDKEILARVKKGEVKFDPADWSDVSGDAIDFIKLRVKVWQKKTSEKWSQNEIK